MGRGGGRKYSKQLSAFILPADILVWQEKKKLREKVLKLRVKRRAEEVLP